MSLFLLDWTKCLFGSTNTFTGSWGSLDCYTSSTSGCHTVSYNNDDCLKLDNHYSGNTYDFGFGCDVQDVSFNLCDISLSKCGTGNLCDVVFKNALGEIVEAKYEWINNCVRVTCAEPIETIKICYDPSWLNYCDLKIGTISCAPVPTEDGVVEGTAGDDLIDVAYVGDPDGDKIDNNDAILAGETGNDDIVVAGDGDDTVIAADGNDEVYGGAGNDDLYGGAGNDVLIGDRESAVYGSPSTTTTVRESFNWSQAPDPHDNTSIDNDDDLNTFTQNTGSVNVTFSTIASVYSPDTNFATDQQKVHSIDSGTETVNAYSSLESELNAKGESATYQWSFDTSVENISFRINDVDFDSTVQVYAYDANGVAVPVDISAGGGVTLKNLDGVAGNETGVSNGGGSADTDPYYSMLVNVAGPVTKLVVKHLQDGYDNAGVNITDLFYDVTVSTDDGVPGDDFIDGGAGDDIIEGNEGNDTLIGGSGDDTIHGGSGDDTIQGDGDSTGNVSPQPAVLDWSDFGSTGATVANGATQDLGGVTVTFGFDPAVSGATATVSGAAQYVETGENFDNHSGLQLYGPTTGHAGDTSTVTLDFASNTGGYSDEVQNVAFRINDIDVGTSSDPHQDILTIHAYDANGVEVPVTFVAEGGQTISGNTITAHDLDNGTINTGTAKGSVLIQIADPVARIVIDYGNGATTDQAVTITDMSLETILADDDAGNDYLDGGDGNDLIEGNEGDDRLIGGDGNDTLLGGDGNDIIDDVRGTDNDGNGDDYADGGAGNDEVWTGKGNDTLLGGDGDDTLGGDDADVIYGGAGDYVDGGAGGNDFDVLDLTGKGPFYLENVTPDSNGNGTNGTVVFVDANGVPTGETLNYVEIEQIIGDEFNRAPEANDDSITTDEDTAVTINVLANDTDPDGDTLTITEATVPAEQGSVEIVNGQLVFTPADDFNGEATISYTVSDPDGNTDTANVVVTVNPVDDAPEANDDTATTDEDTAVTIDVLDNDSDPDNQPLTITEATVPAEQGTVEIVNGQLVFTPADDFNGEATISYTVTDPDGNTDTANVVVTVNPVDDAPEANDDTATTDEDTAVTIDVLDNDSDPDNQPLTITEATVPAEQGSVEIVNGQLVFTPADDFNGEATISYTVTDPDGNTDTANVVVTVNPVDDAPEANDDIATTDEDTAVTIDVLDNDSDPDNQPLTITEATVPAEQGSVEIVNGQLVFTPADDFNGEATISYTVSDPDGNTDTANVVVTVNPVDDAPEANDDTATTDEDTAVTIDVLDNDSDPDNQPLTITEATVPAEQGTVEIVDGKLVFTPADDFNGEATISYTVSDPDGNTDTANVVVTVNPVDDAPEALDDTATTDEDTAVTIDVLDNDSDPDNQPLTITEATVPAEQGSVEIVNGQLVFTPADDFNGEATISYTVSDPDGNTDTANVVVTVNPVDDAPEANDDTATTDEDTAVTIDVLDNDSDPDNQPLTITEATVPAEQGSVEIVNGQLVFTPADDFNGEATISYTVADPDGNTDTANVVVTVNPVDDAPEANDDTATTDEDTAVTIDVLDNDSDPDNQPLTITEATVPAEQGSVEIVNGQLVFTPADDFNGEATISYTVSDPDGNTDTANVVVTVNPVDDAPEALDDTATTDEDTAVTIDVLDNDSDPDNQPLTITEATVPAEQGTVEIVNGQLVFTPADDFNGEATISYTVSDPDGNTDTANVVVTVNPVDDAPEANDDTATTDEDTAVTIDVLDNDSDPDNQPLTITEATVPAEQGSVEIVNGQLVFTPADDFNGEATISYTVSDPDGNTDTANVVVTVNPVDDAPEALDDTATTDEDTAVTIDVLDNDSDPDNQPLTITEATVPAEQGSVEIVNGQLVFTPADDFNGEATISYTVSDPDGNTDTANVVVTVNPVDDAPEALDDTATTDEDTAVTIDVLDNDSDPDNQPLTITEATVPAEQGSVEIVNGQLVFTPADDFNGDATISYTVSDPDGNTDDALVTVTVQGMSDAPDAEDDCAATLEDTPVTIDVLENDSDPDGQPLTITEATVPVDQGTVEIVDGKLVFSPAENFNGPATITYTVSDPDGNTDTAVVNVDVLPVNDLVAVDDVAQTDEDTPVTIDVVANDQNPDGGAPTVIGATVPAAQGTVAIVGNKLVFTPATNFFGEATIDYTIEDEEGAVDVAKVTVTVNSVLEAPIAVDDVETTDFETAVTIDVLENDSDPDGTVLTVIDASVPDVQGSVAIVDNKVVFTPAAGFEGEATISYTIEDADGLTADAVVTVTVNDMPPPPPPVPDGTVEGTSGDDIIDDNYAGDPNGDFVDNDDAILPGDTGDDDLIYGYEGDDTILSGDGDDEVYGGVGNDTILDDSGSDTVFGEDGDDIINTAGGQQSPDTAYPGVYAADSDPFDDRDTVYGGAGNDTITTGDDNDTIYGGTGNDTIDGGVDDDLIYGEDGNDTIIGSEGDDQILGGDGDDLIYGGLTTDVLDLPDDLDGDGDSNDLGEDLVTNNNKDIISGGAGNDTIYGGDDDDLISGGAGNDFVDGGIDDDVIHGNAGDDTLQGGQGDDLIFGGDDNDIIIGGTGEDIMQGGFGNDTFYGGNGGDIVVGGEDADGLDVDVLNLTGSGVDHIVYNSNDPEAGTVFFNDGSVMTFSEIENVIPCFTPGTLIATPRGQVPVEQLHVGDKIITRDNGIQEIAWLGQKEMPGKQLIANPHLKPILIKAGALGNGLPERDMLVSPNHRVLVASDLTQLYFEEREVLAAAKHLVGSAGIHQVDVTNTTYIHFMFERHEVVLSDGAWTESFQPGDHSLKGIGNSQRNEIFELFPELKQKAGIQDYQSARRALKKHEAKLLVR